MKDVSIIESGKEFKFSGTNKLKTELQDEGFCYWVPKDERETGQIFASENREYTPEEINMYGIDQANVNVIFTGIDPEGNPWSVIIDPDTNLPVIEYPDSDIDMTIDPKTGDIIIEPIDGIDPIAEIDGELLGNMDIDPASDIDIVFDPPGDLSIIGDIDGIPSVIDLDLDDMDWETEDCPASIQVMHVPNKTEYTDGEAIDYDGMVVRAFDANGNPWSSTEYPDGYIPVHKLGLPKYADAETAKPIAEPAPGYTELSDMSQISSVASAESIGNMFEEKGRQGVKFNGAIASAFDGAAGDAPFTYAWCNEPPSPWGTWLPSDFCGIIVPVAQISENKWSCIKYGWGCRVQPDGEFNLHSPRTEGVTMTLFSGIDAKYTSSINAGTKYKQNNECNFSSPCAETLTASFSVSVNPKEDHGGSHHSGKF